jgi:hypothetical protein
LRDYAETACESDYIIDGLVVATREIANPLTGARLTWMLVDAGTMRVEVLANQRAVRGELSIGSAISAGVWLQGHVLGEEEVRARFEGVDPDHQIGDSWLNLRRGN